MLIVVSYLVLHATHMEQKLHALRHSRKLAVSWQESGQAKQRRLIIADFAGQFANAAAVVLVVFYSHVDQSCQVV